MKADTKEKILSIELSSECTIVCAEADTEKISSLVSNDLEQIDILARGVEDMDTAYLQMLLSLRAFADREKISFHVSEISPQAQKLCELYGVKFETRKLKLKT
ncbi:STAS domain-containing protein [Desulfobacterales bacterium HSG16]|nr:STAS domain-containing protein [Desulfobacterales bacterium HSG16]